MGFKTDLYVGAVGLSQVHWFKVAVKGEFGGFRV